MAAAKVRQAVVRAATVDAAVLSLPAAATLALACGEHAPAIPAAPVAWACLGLTPQAQPPRETYALAILAPAAAIAATLTSAVLAFNARPSGVALALR